MTSFGSTQKEELPDEGMVIAKRTKDATSTFAGMSAELQIQKQQIEHMRQEIEAIKGLYQTVMGMFETLQRQRAIELNAQVGGGPTQVD